MIAEFSFSNQKNPKAIVVLVPGSNGDGRNMIYGHSWVKFAKEYDLLLVGCYLRDDIYSGAEDYCSMRKGAGERLLEAIEAHCPELDKTNKLYLWGFSAGGQFAYEFACTYPHFTAAFVANKGGVYYTALASQEARKVPGLMFLGELDSPWRKDIIRGLHGLNTAFGARWLLFEESCGHSEGNSVHTSINFFKQLLEEAK